MKNWEKKLREITPYVPGEQPDFPDMIKINTNENPYPPAPGVAKLLKEMDAGKLTLYPNPSARLLVDELSKQYHIAPERIFVGVGSDDVLGMIFMTCFCSDKPILFPDITYSFYDVWADLFRVPYKRMPLDENFCIKKEDYLTENGGIVLANPNAPTSIAVGLDFIRTPSLLWTRRISTSAVSLRSRYLRSTRICWWYRRFPSLVPWRVCVSGMLSVASV